MFGLERDCSLEGHAQWKKKKPHHSLQKVHMNVTVCMLRSAPCFQLVSAQPEHMAEQHLALE